MDVGAGCFLFTSTTSAFGDALTPAPDQPAVWITEEVVAVPKNIYGATKTAAEDLLLALEKAAEIGFGKYIISATTPFSQEDLWLLNRATYLKLNLVDFKTYEVYSLSLIIES